MRNNSKSTRVEIRIPNFMLNDLKQIQLLCGYSSLSNFIRYIMCGELIKFQGVINANKQTHINN